MSGRLLTPLCMTNYLLVCWMNFGHEIQRKKEQGEEGGSIINFYLRILGSQTLETI